MQTEPSGSTADFYQVVSKCANKVNASVSPAKGMKQAVLLHTLVDTFALLHFATRLKKTHCDLGAQTSWNCSWEDSFVAWEKNSFLSRGKERMGTGFSRLPQGPCCE